LYFYLIFPAAPAEEFPGEKGDGWPPTMCRKHCKAALEPVTGELTDPGGENLQTIATLGPRQRRFFSGETENQVCFVTQCGNSLLVTVHFNEPSLEMLLHQRSMSHPEKLSSLILQ
ncbi:hypothetical protein STEG23_012279, partial [Scotinomys teguina]